MADRGKDGSGAGAVDAQTPRRLRPFVSTLAAFAALGAVWFAVSSTLALGASTARAEIEARITHLTGQPVLVDGRTAFTFLPRPRLSLFDVRIGGFEPGHVLRIDQMHAELDLFDALFGRADIARLILVRPELTTVDAEEVLPPALAARALAAAEEAGDAYAGALRYGRSILQRFEGVRNLELRDGAFRPRDGSAAISSVNMLMNWPSRSDPARLSGSLVWNGQQALIDARLGEPVSFLAGQSGPVRLSLDSPSLDVSFEGTGASGDAVALDGTLRVSTPSLGRATRWLTQYGGAVPDIGAISLETQIRHEGGVRLAMDPVQVNVGEQTGRGVLEAVFRDDAKPTVSGSLAFPTLSLDRFAAGIAPLPRHALDFQRPMTVSFIEDFDLDLRLSAADAGLGELPLRQLAATVLFSGGTGILDIGDAEVLGGRAQGRLSIDLTRNRPLAKGRLHLTGVDAAGLAALAGFDAVRATGRADLSAEFEAPATNWAEVLRDNSSTVRLSLRDGAIAGLSAETFLSPGERTLAIAATDQSASFSSLEATIGSRGPYATLDSLRVEGTEGTLTAGGFLSLLDDRLFVEGLFTPPAVAAGEEVFTTSQPVPFRMQGEWPTPTVSVGTGPDGRPI